MQISRENFTSLVSPGQQIFVIEQYNGEPTHIGVYTVLSFNEDDDNLIKVEYVNNEFSDGPQDHFVNDFYCEVQDTQVGTVFETMVEAQCYLESLKIQFQSDETWQKLVEIQEFDDMDYDIVQEKKSPVNPFAKLQTNIDEFNQDFSMNDDPDDRLTDDEEYFECLKWYELTEH